MLTRLQSVGWALLLVLVLGGIGFTLGNQVERAALPPDVGLSFEFREALPILVTWEQDEGRLTLHSEFDEGEVCMDPDYGPVITSTFTFYDPAHCISIADLREAFSKHQEWLIPDETFTDDASIIIGGGVQ